MRNNPLLGYIFDSAVLNDIANDIIFVSGPVIIFIHKTF